MATREENIKALTDSLVKLSAGVTLSDAVDSELGVGQGTAATPKAVKIAYDYTTDVAQSVLEAAKNVTEGSDNVTDLREPLLADVYHEIGTWWISLDNSIPVGGLPHLGHLCARDTYGEFWPWCETNKTVVSDEEWLAYAEAHNDCCPYYSSGDGSTTFRTPKYDQSFLKVLAVIGDTGQMQEAGLPNILGTTDAVGSSGRSTLPTGPYTHVPIIEDASVSITNTTDSQIVVPNFDASLANPIYGNSDTVTPQNFGIIVGVYAVGAVSAPIGETDAANLLNGISMLEAGKASVDLSNLSTAGRSLAAGLGMPSGRYVDLTLGASGITYTAPANGWFTLTKTAQSAGEMVGLIGWPYNQRIISFAQWASAWISCFMPVLAGQQVVAEYTATGATQYFRFIYAEGEEA